MAQQAKTFEASIQRLDEIVKLLERGEVPLEQALALFQEGTSLVGTCTKLLDEAEQQVLKLSKGPDGAPREEAFAHDDFA